MKAILVLTKDLRPELQIHSENDMEAIALRAWSDLYFKEYKDNPEAHLLIVNTVINNESTKTFTT